MKTISKALGNVITIAILLGILIAVAKGILFLLGL